jgi:hypothetical protein
VPRAIRHGVIALIALDLSWGALTLVAVFTGLR